MLSSASFTGEESDAGMGTGPNSQSQYVRRAETRIGALVRLWGQSPSRLTWPGCRGSFGGGDNGDGSTQVPALLWEAQPGHQGLLLNSGREGYPLSSVWALGVLSLFWTRSGECVDQSFTVPRHHQMKGRPISEQSPSPREANTHAAELDITGDSVSLWA